MEKGSKAENGVAMIGRLARVDCAGLEDLASVLVKVCRQRTAGKHETGDRSTRTVNKLDMTMEVFLVMESTETQWTDYLQGVGAVAFHRKLGCELLAALHIVLGQMK